MMLVETPLAYNGELVACNPCAASGPIIPPVGRAANGFDDTEMERACGDASFAAPVLAACTRACA